MENSKKWYNRNTTTIRVRNKNCGRVDIHKNINAEDILWLVANPNLEIEYLDKREERSYRENR